MSYADKLGVPFAVLLGEDEISAGKCSVKDMRSGEQQLLTPEEAVGYLTERLNRDAGTVIQEK